MEEIANWYGTKELEESLMSGWKWLKIRLGMLDYCQILFQIKRFNISEKCESF